MAPNFTSGAGALKCPFYIFFKENHLTFIQNNTRITPHKTLGMLKLDYGYKKYLQGCTL